MAERLNSGGGASLRTQGFPRVLLDVRGGPRQTGLGVYGERLLLELASLAPEVVTPLCWRSQSSGIKSLGLEPWAPWAPRVTKLRWLPDADVIHGTAFGVL